MKKILISSIAILLFSLNMIDAQNITLLPHSNMNGVSLSDALAGRATSRNFSAQSLSLQQLSDLLWAANGVNRTDGKRTAPSARNCQEIDIYLFTSEGVYLYDAPNHLLNQQLKGDYRKEVAMQPFVAKAPVILVYVANYKKMSMMDADAKAFYGATDAGFVSQNVYLYCAAEKLNTVVLGSIHRDKLAQLLNFDGKAILGQPVGFSK